VQNLARLLGKALYHKTKEASILNPLIDVNVIKFYWRQAVSSLRTSYEDSLHTRFTALFCFHATAESLPQERVIGVFCLLNGAALH